MTIMSRPAHGDGGLYTAVAKPMVPVRLLQTGRLAFNAQGQRMSLQRTLDIATPLLTSLMGASVHGSAPSISMGYMPARAI